MIPLNTLEKFIDQFEGGSVLLGPGRFEWKVKTKIKPDIVSVTEIDSGNIPVCHGTINMFGTSIVDDGFILYADVKTSRAEINWQAFKQ